MLPNRGVIASYLGGQQARLLGGDVAPLLDDGLLDLPGVLPRPGVKVNNDQI